MSDVFNEDEIHKLRNMMLTRIIPNKIILDIVNEMSSSNLLILV